MSYTVDVQSTKRYASTLAREVAKAAREAMAFNNVPDGAAVTILLTDDTYIAELNRQYRNEDQATDVLSFPAGEPLPGLEHLPVYLGDIAIAVPFAERQAQAKGHAPEAEMQLLAIHGILHLLGYDHDEPDQKEKMWDNQTAILKRLGLERIRPTEDDHAD